MTLVELFDEYQRYYGARRLQVELCEAGRQAVRTTLRRYKRKALQAKAFVPRTKDLIHEKRTYYSTRRVLPRPITCGSATSPSCP